MEEAAGANPAVLPYAPSALRPLYQACQVFLALAVLLFAINVLFFRSRTVHVVSGFPGPVTVSIDDGEAVELSGPGRREVTVSEGKHVVRFGGAFEGGQEFSIESGFWERFFDRRVFVLNVGGHALLIRQTAVYAATPREDEGAYRVLFGKPFFVFSDIDYPFEDFPAELTVRDTSVAVRKSRLDVLDAEPMEVIQTLSLSARAAEAMDLAEWHLGTHPEDGNAVLVYAAIGSGDELRARKRNFLREGCRRRPVEIQWHRAYQDLRTNAEETKELIREYDAQREAEPGNSALLYLRGRLPGSIRESAPFLERAVAADPGNAFAHYAIGYAHLSRGEWEKAHDAVAEASRAAPDNVEFRHQLLVGRFLAGERESLERDLRRALVESPRDYSLTLLLVQCLSSWGRVEEARALRDKYDATLPSVPAGELAGAFVVMRAAFLYALGDFPEMEKLASGSETPASRRIRFQALVEQGRFDEATKVIPLDTGEIDEPFHFLAVAVVSNSAAWRKRSVELLQKGRPEHAEAGDILTRDEPVPIDEVWDLRLDALEKMILFAALGQLRPDQSAECFAAARRLNRLPAYPSHMIRRITKE